MPSAPSIRQARRSRAVGRQRRPLVRFSTLAGERPGSGHCGGIVGRLARRLGGACADRTADWADKPGVALSSAFLLLSSHPNVSRPSPRAIPSTARADSLELLDGAPTLGDQTPRGGTRLRASKSMRSSLQQRTGTRSPLPMSSFPSHNRSWFANESEVSTPPTDLFDLVIVDEAHHLPSKTRRGGRRPPGSVLRARLSRTEPCHRTCGRSQVRTALQR